MSRHTTYRGKTIDMDTMRRDNGKVPAVGNIGVNARGDKLERGKVIKTAEQMAQERGRTKSIITNTGLKGPQPTSPVEPAKPVQAPKPTATGAPIKAIEPVKKEKELPSGDIIIEGDDNENKSNKR